MANLTRENKILVTTATFDIVHFYGKSNPEFCCRNCNTYWWWEIKLPGNKTLGPELVCPICKTEHRACLGMMDFVDQVCGLTDRFDLEYLVGPRGWGPEPSKLDQELTHSG